MIVHLHESGRLEIAEPDDFKAFSAVAAFGRDRLGAVESAFAGRVRFQGFEHVWIAQDWLAAALELESRPDRRPSWERMIAYARSKGWIDGEPAAVRAHVVWNGSAGA